MRSIWDHPVPMAPGPRRPFLPICRNRRMAMRLYISEPLPPLALTHYRASCFGACGTSRLLFWHVRKGNCFHYIADQNNRTFEPMPKYKKYLTYEDALQKLQHYCAYQDRCHSEVRTKLLDLGIYGEELERVITDLIADDFLNEQRFAESYARGKFRMKKWGRHKITQHLKMKKISAYCIKKGLQEIDEEEYLETLSSLLDKRLDGNFGFEEVGKAAKFVISKGYESNLVWETVKTLRQGSET